MPSLRENLGIKPDLNALESISLEVLIFLFSLNTHLELLFFRF